MYKCFSKSDDVNRLYVPRKFGGRGLLAVEEVIYHEELALGHYLASNPEPWLQKVFTANKLGLEETPADYKRRYSQENLENWKEKPLHGQFLHDTVDFVTLWILLI